jgi:hypothetical protein
MNIRMNAQSFESPVGQNFAFVRLNKQNSLFALTNTTEVWALPKVNCFEIQKVVKFLHPSAIYAVPTLYRTEAAASSLLREN